LATDASVSILTHTFKYALPSLAANNLVIILALAYRIQDVRDVRPKAKGRHAPSVRVKIRQDLPTVFHQRLIEPDIECKKCFDELVCFHVSRRKGQELNQFPVHHVEKTGIFPYPLEPLYA